MKFRGKMVDIAAINDFRNISHSLSKLAKQCVMRIASKKLYFIISDDDVGPKKPFVWCELSADFYFKEYNVAGVNSEHDEIYLSLSTIMLSNSLSTLKHHACTLKIKLTNKQTPCITLEIEQVSDEGTENRQCIHDIPVEILPVKYWCDYAEPQFNDFHVSIQMPSLKLIKNIVERMKNVSHTLIFSADKYGRLTLMTKTNMVKLCAHFPDLSVQSFAVGQTVFFDNNDDDDQEISNVVNAVIDIKKFLMFLHGMQLNNSRTVCSIVQGKMVKLHLEQPGALSLQYFLTQLIT